MSNKASTHHKIPKFLATFASQAKNLPTLKRSSQKSAVVKTFGDSVRVNNLKMTQARIPFYEVPEEKFPAIYFTRQGQHPVMIQSKSPEGYAIKLWDKRESLCDQARLEKTLEPEGYFFEDRNRPSRLRSSGCKDLGNALIEEKRNIGLGLTCGAVTCSILVVFVFLLHHAFESAFPIAEMFSPLLASLGIVSALLSTCGYLQARSFVIHHFDNFYNTNKAREIKMPPPFPIRALTEASSGRMLVEAASAPFFLATASILMGWDMLSVSNWSALISLSIPGFLFLYHFPTLWKRWNEALWFFEQQEKPTQQPEEKDPENAPKIDRSVVRTHNLFLAHPAELNQPLVDHISLKIAKGEQVGFIGTSPGDVAVFLRVLAGRLDSDRGLVWIDGQMVQGQQVGNIGWFSERTSLIDGTLRENIDLDQKALTDADIHNAAALTGLNRTQLFQNGGLEYRVTESGAHLTDVEKMLLLLTRSLAHMPDTLIFDSPRDSKLNSQFREILDLYLSSKQCTLLLGVKQESQLAGTNRTIVLNQGKIINDGPTIEATCCQSSEQIGKG